MIPINDRFFLLIKAVILGLLIVGLMILDGNLERIFIIAFVLMIISIIRNFKPKINYVFFIFIGLIIGYIFGNFLLLYYSAGSNDNIEEINGNDDKLNKPAVILFMEAQPTTFDTYSLLNGIYSDNSIIRKINAPIEILQLKIAYENTGGSRSTELCDRIKEDLKLRLGIDYDVYLAYFNIDPLINQEINRLGEKYEKVILVPLMLSESEQYRELVNAIENNSLRSHVDIKITPFLWKSKKLSKQLLKEAIEMAGKDDVDDSGVILLMSDRYNFYEQGIFCNEVISRMETSGFDKDNLICLKHDGKDRLLEKNIRLLGSRGVDNLIIISASDLEENVKKQNRIRNILEKTEEKEYVNIMYKNGWGISENLLNELELKIRMANIKD